MLSRVKWSVVWPIICLIALSGSTLAQEDGGSTTGQGTAPVTRQPCQFASAAWSPEFGTKVTATAPGSFASGTSISEDDSVVVTVKLNCDVAVVAHASIGFMSTTSNRGKVVQMKATSDGKSLKGRLKAADLKPVGPEVSLLLSIGGPKIKPSQWDAGKIAVMHRNGQQRILEPPQSKHEALFAVPPFLSHTFNPTRAEPSIPVALLSSLATAVPLLGLAYMLFVKLGANVGGVTAGGPAATLASVAFLGSIAAALGLGVVYWLKLRLVDLFVPLGSLSVFMVLVGHQALSRMADLRMQREKSQKND